MDQTWFRVRPVPHPDVPFSPRTPGHGWGGDRNGWSVSSRWFRRS